MAKFILTTQILSLLLPWALAAPADGCSDQFSPSCYDASHVITRDVAIIGGGSSGTFAAITLKDLNKSVVVVEKQSLMGGHVETYTDPGSGSTIDYGVQLFWNTSVVTEFFARVNAPVAAFVRSTGVTTAYADLSTGALLPGFAPSTNFTAYQALLDQFPYFGSGYDLPSPVPEDLTLPFGEFIEKYSLQDIAFSIWVNPATGSLANILNIPTVHIFKALDETVFLESAPGGAILSATNNNHQAFANAQAELGSNVLLSSTVCAAERSSNGSGVSLIVDTPSGKQLIKASKVLFTAPQTIANLSPFDLDSKESSVFSKLNTTGFYAGLITNTSLPTATSYQNAVADSTNYNIPAQPNVMHLTPTAVSGIHSFWYQSTEAVGAAKAESDIKAAIAKVTNASADGTQFVAFADHSPAALYVSPEDVAAGFWSDVNALQGYRDTWYTGLLLEPASGPLWVFTKNLIDQMFA